MIFNESVKSTRKEEMINITPLVEKALHKSGIHSGISVVYVPHTTAGFTINENADPDVPRDILMGFRHAIPSSLPYAHAEGNSDAHLKAAITGSSVTIIVEEGRLQLGTWQGIFFCEFDGPRERRIYIKFLS